MEIFFTKMPENLFMKAPFPTPALKGVWRFHNLHRFLDFPHGYALMDWEFLSEGKPKNLAAVSISTSDPYSRICLLTYAVGIVSVDPAWRPGVKEDRELQVLTWATDSRSGWNLPGWGHLEGEQVRMVFCFVSHECFSFDYGTE